MGLQLGKPQKINHKYNGTQMTLMIMIDTAFFNAKSVSIIIIGVICVLFWVAGQLIVCGLFFAAYLSIYYGGLDLA